MTASKTVIEFLQKFGIVIVFAVLGFLFLVERRWQLRKPRHSLRQRLFVNGTMSLLTFSAAALLVKPAALSTLAWTNENRAGLLQLLHLPAWAEGVAGFLLLDLSFYYWHRLNHKIPFLWRFHNVHHIDPDLDASTGFRFHFGEVALSTIFRVIQVLALGISIPLFVIYEFVFQIATYFHHSNLRLPERIDRLLNLGMVTPRMHGIHHSNFREETNSNYSVVISLWDRIHRTFRSDISQANIDIGVPGYAQPDDNRLFSVILAPFRAQRDYWRDRERR